MRSDEDLQRLILDYLAETRPRPRRQLFQDLIEELQPELVAGVRWELSSLHDVEDAVQETILDLWRGTLDRFDASRVRHGPRAWFRKLAQNRARDLRRKLRRRPLPIPDERRLPDRRNLGPQEDLAALANAEALAAALAALSADHRRVVVDRLLYPGLGFRGLAELYAPRYRSQGRAAPNEDSLEAQHRRALAALKAEMVHRGLGPEALRLPPGGVPAYGEGEEPLERALALHLHWVEGRHLDEADLHRLIRAELAPGPAEGRASIEYLRSHLELCEPCRRGFQEELLAWKVHLAGSGGKLPGPGGEEDWRQLFGSQGPTPDWDPTPRAARAFPA